VRRIYQTEGLRGFYRGMSASYAGISETVLHFVMYEELKKRLRGPKGGTEGGVQFFGVMAAGAVSKLCASCLAYPHGKLGGGWGGGPPRIPLCQPGFPLRQPASP